jgi:hypothetical protein
MTDSGVGRKMALYSRLPGSSRGNLTLRAVSTGSSWVHTARRSGQAVRRPVGPWAPKRDRTSREDGGVSPALGFEPVGSTGRVLHLWSTLVTDGNGLPMGALLTAGQRHEAPFFTEVMNAVRVPRTVGRPKAVARGGLRRPKETEPTIQKKTDDGAGDETSSR